MSGFNCTHFIGASTFIIGTRYRRRGIDSSGAVANFVETEQVQTLLVCYVLKCFSNDKALL